MEMHHTHRHMTMDSSIGCATLFTMQIVIRQLVWI